MKLYLIGHPVSHSISPAIQNAALRACGLDGSYELLDTPPVLIAETVASLRQAGVAGGNVTVPHKQAVVPHLDALAPQAARIGAVNTIAHQDGRLVGHNTDAAGFLASVREAGVHPGGMHVVLLGAGGAAHAIAFALVDAGVSKLTVLNRDAHKAKLLVEAVSQTASNGQHVAASGIHAHEMAAALESAQLVVNATTVGMRGNECLVGRELLSSDSVVCDIIYNPAETELLRRARLAGARRITGLGMLVHQAAQAFTIWTGRTAPLAAMYRAATEALKHQEGRR